MNSSPATITNNVERALKEWAPYWERVSGATWRLEFHPDLTYEMKIRLKDNWLLFQMPLTNGAVNNDIWNYLCANSTLPGRSKIILEPHDYTMYVQQDLPVVAEAEVSGTCRQAVTDILQAISLLRKTKAEQSGSSQDPTSPFVPEDSCDSSNDPAAPIADEVSSDLKDSYCFVKEACNATGWHFSERESGRLSVRLDVPNSFHKALVDASSKHGVHLFVPMTKYESLTGTQRRAVATFLLQANGLIRFVRAAAQVAVENGNKKGKTAQSDVSYDWGATTFLEACFAELPSEKEIDFALSAMSVACSFCSRELESLRHQDTARAFLNVRGNATRMYTSPLPFDKEGHHLTPQGKGGK